MHILIIHHDTSICIFYFRVRRCVPWNKIIFLAELRFWDSFGEIILRFSVRLVKRGDVTMCEPSTGLMPRPAALRPVVVVVRTAPAAVPAEPAASAVPSAAIKATASVRQNIYLYSSSLPEVRKGNVPFLKMHKFMQ